MEIKEIKEKSYYNHHHCI